MSSLDLIVRTTRLLCGNDMILQMALDEADAEEPAVAFFLTSLICHAFEHGQRVNEAALVELWSDWSKLIEEAERPDSRLADVIQVLSSEGVLKFDNVEYTIDVTHLPIALCALFFDLRTRNLVSAGNARDCIVGLLELSERAVAELANCDDEAQDFC